MFTVKTEEVDSNKMERFAFKTEAKDSDDSKLLILKTEVEDLDESEMFNVKTETEDLDETVVALDTYNSDLNLVIDAGRFSAKPLTTEGFIFMWAGARATHGASRGKFCFEVKLLDYLNGEHLSAEDPNSHVVRVGFSVESSTMQLGEDSLSYGYDGTGKITANCHFQDFGETFTAGDVILGVVDADTEEIQIGFAKNGQFLGWAFQVGEKELKGHSLFPHVLTKNVSFEVNLGQKDQPYFPLPDTLTDFTFIGHLPLTQRERGTRGPKRREDCEVIMICGLPGAGKSTWAANYAANNPAKQYNVLGVKNIVEKMKVMGMPIPRIPHGKFKLVRRCCNILEEIGSNLKRNYILDNSHTTPKMHIKMCDFVGFRRKAVVVLPSEEEFERRLQKKELLKIEEGGKGKPKWLAENLLLMQKKNFKLPEVNDIFHEVIYTELQKEDAEKLIIQYQNISATDVWKSRKKKIDKKDVLGFCNEADDNNGNFNKSHQGGYGDSRGCKRKFVDSTQEDGYLSFSVAHSKGNSGERDSVVSVRHPFKRDYGKLRYFSSHGSINNFQIGGCHGSNSNF